MKIIINADDLGISEEVNAAIFELMDAGLVTSATLMANGLAVDSAARQAKVRSRQSFGVHLNLTEFWPLRPVPGLKPLLQASGEFAGNMRELVVTPALKEAIFVEWCAQVRRVVELGVNISHLDSHHHVHTIPALLLVLKRVQREFGVRRVRLSKNLYGPQNRPGAARLVAKAGWNFLLRHWYPTRTTSAFTSFEDFADGCTPVRCASVELMAHPGAPRFQRETDSLRGDWRTRLPFATELVSYHSI